MKDGSCRFGTGCRDKHTEKKKGTPTIPEAKAKAKSKAKAKAKAGAKATINDDASRPQKQTGKSPSGVPDAPPCKAWTNTGVCQYGKDCKHWHMGTCNAFNDPNRKCP